MTDLKDRIVFVTGASAGIGEATAELFAEHGARLILAARRQDRIAELAKRVDVDCYAIELDVRDRSGVEKAIANLPDDWSTIDVLVNNAGLASGLSKLHEGDIEDWEKMIDTNIKGLLWVSRAVIPGMVKRGRGHVINIGSIAGREVYPSGNVYCSTKFAVRALTKGMMIDLVDTPIKVSTIDPGLVETEFSQVRFHGDTERAKKTYQGYTPLAGRDIAEAVVWAATRPAHVQIAEMVVMPKAQASAMVLHKR